MGKGVLFLAFSLILALYFSFYVIYKDYIYTCVFLRIWINQSIKKKEEEDFILFLIN